MHVLPAIPTAVKMEAETAANIVPAREKWIMVSLGLRPLRSSDPSGRAEVILCLLYFFSRNLFL
jgi:hypothetical protein